MFPNWARTVVTARVAAAGKAAAVAAVKIILAVVAPLVNKTALLTMVRELAVAVAVAAARVVKAEEAVEPEVPALHCIPVAQLPTPSHNVYSHRDLLVPEPQAEMAERVEQAEQVVVVHVFRTIMEADPLVRHVMWVPTASMAALTIIPAPTEKPAPVARVETGAMAESVAMVKVVPMVYPMPTITFLQAIFPAAALLFLLSHLT